MSLINAMRMNDRSMFEDLVEYLPELTATERMFFTAIYRGDEGLVRTLLARGVSVDCVQVDGNPCRGRPEAAMRMPLDHALEHGHGTIARRLLDAVGSGRDLPGMHPECVRAAHAPPGLLRVCRRGAQVVMRELIGPSAIMRSHQHRQRRAMAEAVYTVLQSSHVHEVPAGMPLDYERADLTVAYLVDLRVPGVLKECIYGAGALFELAAWVRHDDLAARLYLVGMRYHGSSQPQQPVRRFVARAVVRTLLRRYVKTRLIMWYWREAAERGKYAAPDAAGFEADMAAPLFTEGALGA